MQHPLSLLVKITGATAACLLAYRGLQLYLKNDITIYITEVVHLPETAGRRRRPQIDPNLQLTIEGKVEMETCLMSSYRFLLKLVGHVRTALPDAGKASPSMSPRSARHRVLSIQTSGVYNSFRDDDSVSNASMSGSRKSGGPTLIINAVDAMVDAYETASSGLLAFTPACLGEGLLCRYTCSAGGAGNTEDASGTAAAAAAAGGGATSERGVSVSSIAPASPFARSILQRGDNGLGNVYVRSCFLESDGETAYCQKLTMELEFIRPAYGTRVVIRLPSKYCRIQRSSTGGVGSVTQLMRQPRKCVWDIGEVTEAMCGVATREEAAEGESSTALRMMSMMPGAAIPASESSVARLELVFEQPPPGISFGEEDEEALSSEDTEEEDDNRFNSTASSAKSATSRRRTQSARRRGNSGSTASLPSAASGRSRKREERARKAAEKAARIEEGGTGAEARARGGASSSGGTDELPTVEVVYSVNQLLSGTAVRKLQVLQETPNWVPRSRLDRLVLRRLMPHLQSMKLKKFAHYTTWFVQPVAVSQL